MKRIYFIFLIVMLILLAVATKYDYYITDTLYGYLDVYAQVVGVFGVMFYYLSVSSAIVIFNKLDKIQGNLLVLVVFIAMGYNMKHEITEYENIFNIIIILWCILMYLCFMFIFKKHLISLSSKLPFYLVTFNGLSLATVGFFKLFWARPRYLAVKDGMYEFSKWYNPNMGLGKDDLLQSFISGHSAAIFNSLFIVFLVSKKYQKLTFSLLLIFSFVFSLGRLFSGSHFLSDIVVSAIIVSTYFIILYEINKKYDYM